MAPSFQPGWDVLIIVRPAIVDVDHEARTAVLAVGRAGADVGEELGRDPSVLDQNAVGPAKRIRGARAQGGERQSAPAHGPELLPVLGA